MFIKCFLVATGSSVVILAVVIVVLQSMSGTMTREERLLLVPLVREAVLGVSLMAIISVIFGIVGGVRFLRVRLRNPKRSH